MAQTLTGGCLCGAVRYKVSADLIFSGKCYCGDCRRTSSSGHGSVYAVPEAAVTITPAVGLLNVSLRDTTTLAIGPLTINGNLFVHADGITSSGALVVSAGTTTLTSQTAATTPVASAISLSNPLNNFGTVSIVNASTVTIVDDNNIDLGASTVTE